MEFELLKPLIIETAKKLNQLTPKEAQTGPARRNDKTTIKKHLGILQEASHTELYQLFTNAILKTYGKKL